MFRTSFSHWLESLSKALNVGVSSKRGRRRGRLSRHRSSITAFQRTESLECRALLSAAPVLTGLGGTVNYSQSSSPVDFATDLAITDSDSTNLGMATISFTNWQAGDRLDWYNAFNLQHTFTEDLANHTATLDLTGSSSIADYQATIRDLAFYNVAGAPVSGTRVATVSVNDGGNTSNLVSENIAMGTSAPVLSGLGGTVTFHSGASPVGFGSDVTITDSDSNYLSSATVTFTNWQAGDRLDWYNASNLQHTFTEDLTSHTASLTLSGGASLAAYQSTLRDLAFYNVAGAPDTTTRVANFQVNDGNSNSNLISESISVVPTPASATAPVVTGMGGNVTYTQGGPSAKFALDVGISDSDSTQLASATISFTSWQPGDRIDWNNTSNLQHSFTEDLVNHTATLLLSGANTLAAYQTTLQGMGFYNVAGAPVTTARTASVRVSDGSNDSNTISEVIQYGVS